MPRERRVVRQTGRMAVVLLTGLFAVQAAALVVEHAVVLPKVHMAALDAMTRLGVQ